MNPDGLVYEPEFIAAAEEAALLVVFGLLWLFMPRRETRIHH